MVKVSVIVPIYNVEEYINKCIDSILNQTFKEFELILVDDGSTDNSGNICDTYKSIDDRVRVIHKDNGGLSDARNFGIEAATGEFLYFIDGDDFIHEDTLESMYNSIMKTNSDIAVCNMIRYYGEEDTEKFYNPVEKMKVLNENYRFETLRQPSVCNKMFKSILFKNIKFPLKKYYEDTFVYHELLFKANRVVLTGKDSYYYRSRRGSIISGGYNKKYFDFIEAVYLRALFLDKNNVHNYADEAYLHLYSSLANAYKNIEIDEPEMKSLLEKSKVRYNEIFKRIITDNHFSIKQKIRFFILRYYPKLHCKIY